MVMVHKWFREGHGFSGAAQSRKMRALALEVMICVAA